MQTSLCLTRLEIQKTGDSDSVVKGFYIMQIPAASNSFAPSQQMSLTLQLDCYLDEIEEQV